MAQENEHMGMNKTGVQMSPFDTKAMLSDDNILERGYVADETAAASPTSGKATASARFQCRAP
jgi:hypothetical protein